RRLSRARAALARKAATLCAQSAAGSRVLGSPFAQKQALAATDDSRTAHAVNASVWPGFAQHLVHSILMCDLHRDQVRACSLRRTSLSRTRSSNDRSFSQH